MSRTEPPLVALSELLLPTDQAAAIEVRANIQAAVLVPLHIKRGVLHAVFTRRHHELPRHAGEISFPGGRRDAGDADLVATALRETHEEVGLPADSVQVIGALEPIPTVVTGYAIHPFVGIVPGDYRWTPSDREVAAVIDLPLPAVAAGYGRRRLVRRGAAIRTDTYVVDDHMIWGATARIVSDLLDRLDGLLTGSSADEATGASAA
ncbi:MAG TPA: CoA pyrophosphatase [Solirubrobacteraceae bacterium]|jgi:8-oxo-dGTP pyrophosphatase MutT (NUDIX family)|nr:CoA pyrophosphatase [Solirubrobacteraceae bacterium]